MEEVEHLSGERPGEPPEVGGDWVHQSGLAIAFTKQGL